MILKVGIGIAALWLLFGRKRKAFAHSTTATTIIADTDTVTWSVPLGKNVEQPSKDGQPIGSVRVTGTHAASKAWLEDLQSDRPRTRLEIAVGAGETTEAHIFVHDAVAAECGQAEYSAWINRIEGYGENVAPLAVAEIKRAGRTWRVWDYEGTPKGVRLRTRLAEYPEGSLNPATGVVTPGFWVDPADFTNDGGIVPGTLDFGELATAAGRIAAAGAVGFVVGGPVGAFAGAASAGAALAAQSGANRAELDKLGMGAQALARYDACGLKGGTDEKCSLEATGKTGVSVGGVLRAAT